VEMNKSASFVTKPSSWNASGASSQLRGVVFGAAIRVNSKIPRVGQIMYRSSEMYRGFVRVTIRAFGVRPSGRIKTRGGFEDSGPNWTFGVVLAGSADSRALDPLVLRTLILIRLFLK
jgi:hypothetical protein